MNNTRRKAIKKILVLVEILADELETLQDEEQEYVDNMPENMQSGERYENAEAAAKKLSECVDGLKDVVNVLEEIE